jgi:hypothetical protein
MHPIQLQNAIKAVIPNLNKEWKEKYALFLTDENLYLFAANFIAFYSQNTEIVRKPYFKDEIIISIQENRIYFEAVLEAFKNNSDQLEFQIIKMFEETPFDVILLILGQRLTSASRRDETGIPPSKSTLFESCFEPYNSEISIVERAWEKHVGRTKDSNSVLGEIKGNRSEKRLKVERLVYHIIGYKTWWNTFYHYKHGLVYEVRVENGQGLRWSADGKQFIGFLEHFLEE